jgi:hypothetical protein
MRAPPGVHHEVYAHLLRVRIVGHLRPDLARVQAVAYEQMLDGRLCRSHVRLRKRLPQVQPRRVDQLAAVGGIGIVALHRYVAHEPAILGDDSHRHAVGGRRGGIGIYLDVFVGARGIQPLDGRVYVRQPQRCALLERDNVSQFRGRQRLFRRDELNIGDRLRPSHPRAGQQPHR